MNPALQGYLAAVGESLAASGALAEAGAELRAVAELVDASTDLSLVLNDGSISVASRRAVVDDLLTGKVRPEVRRLVDRAVGVVAASDLVVALHWLASQVVGAAERRPETQTLEDEPVLGRLASRNRVNGYAAAVFEDVDTAELEEIEDQLFRFARTVESNRALRSALGDRDLPIPVRQGVVDDLLAGQALASTRRIAAYAVRGGRARDIVSTLDALTEEAARARGWRVARVRSADEVTAAQREGLGGALAQLAGGPVELHVTIDPTLLAGVVVQIGDLLVDGSARHRLDQLKEHLLASEAAYRVPEGREDS